MSRRIQYVGNRERLEELMEEDETVAVLHEMSENDVGVIDAELELLTVEEARERFSEIEMGKQ